MALAIRVGVRQLADFAENLYELPRRFSPWRIKYSKLALAINLVGLFLAKALFS